MASTGRPVPETPHAVSVSLPTWKANIGYEEGEDWVVSKMKTGYPRFFIHLTIQELEKEILSRYGRSNERVMFFPSQATARRCQLFICDKIGEAPADGVRLLRLEPRTGKTLQPGYQRPIVSGLSCVFFPGEHFSIAKQVWQHSGDGISSRRAEFCLSLLKEDLLQPAKQQCKPRAEETLLGKGPRRYQRGTSQNGILHETSGNETHAANGLTPTPASEGKEYAQFVEERFGRNLNADLASQAKLAVRRRIAGCLGEAEDLDQALEQSTNCSTRRVAGLTSEDVYLFPTGMSSIFNTHRTLLASAAEPRKSICFGFPYIDTLKILQKWGPGCLFYGHGDEADLKDLERRLQKGERYLALFTEFPSNPLLRSPNLFRIRQLASKYDFAVIVDETVSNFINIDTLSDADVVVSSLTKIFSGDCNVMGGSCTLNPSSPYYRRLKDIMSVEYEDNYWAEDAVFMERNSRDFTSRIERININAEAVASALLAHKPALVKNVYYPSHSPDRANYDAHRNPSGGYGGLLSVTFQHTAQAVSFFDLLEIAKGPSLGTNFTLACPYTILAHYGELEWAGSVGVERDLVRVSIGLEETDELVGIFERALKVAAECGPVSETVANGHS